MLINVIKIRGRRLIAGPAAAQQVFLQGAFNMLYMPSALIVPRLAICSTDRDYRPSSSARSHLREEEQTTAFALALKSARIL